MIKYYNPIQSSLWEPSLNFERYTDPIDISLFPYKKTVEIFFSGEELFYKKSDQQIEHLRLEYFISLLCRGVINLAEFICIDGKYYSWMMKHNNFFLREGEDLQIAIDADRFILAALFGDEDHYIDKEPKDSFLGGGMKQHTNLVIDEHTQRYYLFDIDHVFEGLFHLFIKEPHLRHTFKDRFINILNGNIFNKEDEMSIIEDECYVDYPSFKERPQLFFDAVDIRLREIEERLEFAKGSNMFFYRLVEKSRIDLYDDICFSFLSEKNSKMRMDQFRFILLQMITLIRGEIK